jgi:hypothetical protein
MNDRPHWNWQQTDWPEFRFDRSKVDSLEAEFLRQSGVFSGCIRHIAEGDLARLRGLERTKRSKRLILSSRF